MPYAARNRLLGEEFKESMVRSQGFLEVIGRGGKGSNKVSFGAGTGLGTADAGGLWTV
jgi:hypothetical protein